MISCYSFFCLFQNLKKRIKITAIMAIITNLLLKNVKKRMIFYKKLNFKFMNNSKNFV